MRKILLTAGLLFGGCFAQITELEQELKDTRLLAALGLLEAQNKGSSSGFTAAISMEAMGDDTNYIALYNLTVTKCQLGASGYGCFEGTGGTYQFAMRPTTLAMAERIRGRWMAAGPVRLTQHVTV